MIRPARWDDRPAIVRLIVEMGGHEGVAQSDDPLHTLGEVLTSPDSRAFVAERDERVIGYAHLHARVASSDDRREGWLGALCVAGDARGTGIGTALVAAVEAAAALLGCSVVVVESAAWREAAHAFYRARGFEEKPAARRFVRALGSPRGSLEERFLASAGAAASAVQAAIVALGDREPVGIGADGAPTEAADAAAERAAIGALAGLGLPIVSEEAGLVGTGALDPGLPWISLDPLDGSRNFVAGHPSYAISVGLVADGGARAGFVCDLDSGHRWWAVTGAGAWRDGRPLRTRSGSGLVAMPSPPARDGTSARFPGFERIRISGSTALDLCRVADGAVAAFVSLERPVVHVHDLAGALPIVLEAGGAVVDERGSPPLLLPDPARCMRLLAAANPALLERFLGVVYG